MSGTSQPEDYSSDSSPPAYHEDGLTVKALASNIEQEIFAKFRNQAKEMIMSGIGSSASLSKQDIQKTSKRDAEDLKAKLQPSLDELDRRTTLAIKRIVREKYFADVKDQ
ncbi:HDR075Wp [Eremothecium sinecaudum]|uniref:HDR075Wp n=1 Tax=Eremothecium sinecaudum TaxID=45286 RepID=A0A0X8HSU6_9SACH|nr:HDR075Wp [Eremothecium sinecaudum]AMD20817.1 HDR075Wp [Eremothecium sinecaudum]